MVYAYTSLAVARCWSNSPSCSTLDSRDSTAEESVCSSFVSNIECCHADNESVAWNTCSHRHAYSEVESYDCSHILCRNNDICYLCKNILRSNKSGRVSFIEEHVASLCDIAEERSKECLLESLCGSQFLLLKAEKALSSVAYHDTGHVILLRLCHKCCSLVSEPLITHCLWIYFWRFFCSFLCTVLAFRWLCSLFFRSFSCESLKICLVLLVKSSIIQGDECRNRLLFAELLNLLQSNLADRLVVVEYNDVHAVWQACDMVCTTCRSTCFIINPCNKHLVLSSMIIPNGLHVSLIKLRVLILYCEIIKLQRLLLCPLAASGCSKNNRCGQCNCLKYFVHSYSSLLFAVKPQFSRHFIRTIEILCNSLVKICSVACILLLRILDTAWTFVWNKST